MINRTTDIFLENSLLPVSCARDKMNSTLYGATTSAGATFEEVLLAQIGGTTEDDNPLYSAIYECNVCRNLFRSRKDFFVHKSQVCRVLSDGSKDGPTDRSNRFGAPSTATTTSSVPEEGPGDNYKKEKKAWKEAKQKLKPSTSSQFVGGAVVKLEAPVVDNLQNESANCPANGNVAGPPASKKVDPALKAVYECPKCLQTFAPLSFVIHHLVNYHSVDISEATEMRDHLKELYIPVAPDADKKGNREMKRLSEHITSVKVDEADMVEQKKHVFQCPYCRKTFERKAGLSTHVNFCRPKYELIRSGVEVPPKRPKSSKYEAHTKTRLKTGAVADKKVYTAIKMEAGVTESYDEMYAQYNTQAFGTGLQTVSLDKLDMSSDETTNSDSNTISPLVSSTNSTPMKAAKRSHAGTPRPHIKKKAPSTNLHCMCKICKKKFECVSNARRHISMFHHRRRKFGCKECGHRAFRRCDIIKHLYSTHELPGNPEELSEKYVSVHENHRSREDVDDDILIIAKDTPAAVVSNLDQPLNVISVVENENLGPMETLISSVSSNASSASSGEENLLQPVPVLTAPSSRSKPIPTSTNPWKAPSSPTLTRSCSQQSLTFSSDSTFKHQTKRPKRNRVKPVNKDFIYDLSPQNATDALKTPKRRHTLTSGSTQKNLITFKPFVAPIKSEPDKVKGNFERTNLRLFQEGRAKNAIMPVLPAERPKMRTHFVVPPRCDKKDSPVIDLEAARRNSTLLDDSFLEIAKPSTSEFKMKPRLALERGTLSSLLEKVDSSNYNSTKQIQQEALNLNFNSSSEPAAVVDTAPSLSPNNHYEPAVPVLATAIGFLGAHGDAREERRRSLGNMFRKHLND